MSKRCPMCGVVKSVAEFYRARRSADGLVSACKVCHGKRAKGYRESPKARAARGSATERAKRAQHYTEYGPGYRARPEVKVRMEIRRFESRLRRAYGLEVEDYARMMNQQDRRCAICGDRLGRGKEVALDHCHRLGASRGILCHHCNTMLGHARDSNVILRRAIEYLNAVPQCQ